MLLPGAVAKWLGNGLQNRHTSVRIRSAPPGPFPSLTYESIGTGQIPYGFSYERGIDGGRFSSRSRSTRFFTSLQSMPAGG